MNNTLETKSTENEHYEKSKEEINCKIVIIKKVTKRD